MIVRNIPLASEREILLLSLPFLLDVDDVDDVPVIFLSLMQSAKAAFMFCILPYGVHRFPLLILPLHRIQSL